MTSQHQLAAETASAEARRLQALADELPVQRERAEEAEGQLSQERRSFVEKRQAWQAEREEMERSMQVRSLARCGMRGGYRPQ